MAQELILRSMSVQDLREGKRVIFGGDEYVFIGRTPEKDVVLASEIKRKPSKLGERYGTVPYRDVILANQSLCFVRA